MKTTTLFFFTISSNFALGDAVEKRDAENCFFKTADWKKVLEHLWSAVVILFKVTYAESRLKYMFT